jgi:hypothetical protein
MIMLGLTLCEPPWRQLRSWISPLYHIHHTVQTWHHTTSTFSKNEGRLSWTLNDSNEEVERIVRTWMKKQSVEFFHVSFQKLVQHWKKCVENRGDYMEKQMK